MNNGVNPDELTSILMVVLVVMVVLLLVLAGAYLVFYMKRKKLEEKPESAVNKSKTKTSDVKLLAKEYTKQSIFDFMEFDKIEDNMIIQKNGMRYLMVVECQGVNYDLMSSPEKMAVEEGFLQFLNTLRHPIQIYVQTRTVNLGDSIDGYRKNVEAVKIELEKKKNEYLRKIQTGQYPKEELDKEFYEVTKMTNLYEYGKDVISNTERMSLNKNVLSKKYYVILSYYPEDVSTTTFDKEEIKNMAFSELYTKAQAIIRTLMGCEVGGKILDSNQLVDLLYVAYNRDESEVFGIDKALRAGYEELYTTAPEVIDRKMKLLDIEIDKKALEYANEKIITARSMKEQKYEQMEKSFEDLIRERAELILKQNERFIGKKTAAKAQELVKEDKEKARANKKTKEEGGSKDVGQEKTKTTRSRVRKSE